MSPLRMVMVAALIAAVVGFGGQAWSAEYYVVESRSGVILITDHAPQGGATVLKGPFETKEAAEEALSTEETERLGTPGQGRGQRKGLGKGRGSGQGKNR